ncbi:ABC transporter ATP-binding protein [Winogradskyella thalassocola]|uniref:ABC-type multidrug transport system, ATPase component n=1 Tax=Winogradskyella thalassocola TaxID=262004 RepID=A0A1G8LB99_9FLAO|nr:ABC transporter ATP-binding protein [Winogradskyella thalassocola]SDI52510.1 ABC-type multidrug transport system, ATPase component [Winogradskyella thalassocola]
MSISVSHISKSYKKVKALQDISFEVKPNEIFGLIGPDGAGKTTLFRVLTTLLFPDEGVAKVMDYDVVNDYKKIRNCVGYMPGKFSLYQDLTVEENLTFFATIFGTTIEENYDLIKDIYVQIAPFKDRRAGKLSGGMKQKLALCCALIHKPQVLFLDEPTTGVDPVSRKEFWEMLKRLQQKDITILVSTPYMDEAALCDRIALIQDGKILEIDTPEAIVKHYPKQIYNVRANNMYKLINSLKDYEYNHSVYPFGEFVHYTDSRTNFNPKDLIRYLETKNLSNIHIDKTVATIEDTFMELAK